MRDNTMGRTRLGRFAAVTVPATLATAGLGFAMVTGMVGAALSSAGGFNLESDAITSSALAVRPGSAPVAGDADGAETIYAQTGATTSANKINVVASVDLPLVLPVVYLEVNSTDANVALGQTILNATELAVADKDTAVEGTTGDNAAAALSNVKLGIAQSEAGFTDQAAAGYVGDGFALSAGSSTLNNVDADAYAIELTSLALDNLTLGISLTDPTP